MSNHTPKVPDDRYWPKILRLTINIDTGKVYHWEGRELYCKPQKTREYVFIGVGDRQYKRAHLVWWKATGEWPKFMIDHKDRNKLNDAFLNLGYTDSRRNALNNGKERALPTGVVYNKLSGKYMAAVHFGGEQVNLGYYSTPEEAGCKYVNFLKDRGIQA